MAGVATDGAEVARQLAAARQREQAVSRVMRAVARSEGLESVLHAVTEAAGRLSGSEASALYLVEGELLRVAVMHGTPEVYEYEKDHPHVRDRTTLTGRVAVTGEVVHITDVENDPEYSWEGQRAGPYPRVLLGVPVSWEGELIGVFGLSRQVRVPFTDDQIALVETFADQAAIAIANARLIEAVERQLEQQRAVADVLRTVARFDPLEKVFEHVVELAKRLCDAEFGALFLADGDVFRFASGHSGESALERHDREHAYPRDRRTAIGRVALTRDVVHIPDVESDIEYEWGGKEVAEYRTVLAAPIVVERELIGAMDVARRECRPFTGGEIDLLRTFADQAAIAIANARLIDAVERQRTELARFVSPQVAELVSSDEGEKLLAGHRAYITVLFCDLRSFTAFAETAAPEELFEVLRAYHAMLGELIPRYDGTLEHFAGDGVMVFFNDPVPVERHELAAISLALEAQERFRELARDWSKREIELGLGIGIATGYATLGRIGFEGRYDYGALGPITNLASRLSSEAEAGQTLIGVRVYAAVEEHVDAVEIGRLELRGFQRPVAAYEVRGLR